MCTIGIEIQPKESNSIDDPIQYVESNDKNNVNKKKITDYEWITDLDTINAMGEIIHFIKLKPNYHGFEIESMAYAFLALAWRVFVWSFRKNISVGGKGQYVFRTIKIQLYCPNSCTQRINNSLTQPWDDKFQE